MAIAWSSEQEAAVAAALARHPVLSSRCAAAAAEILPVALERDPLACARRCDPVYGRYVHDTYLWYHHVTVSAANHHVDALTGAGGVEIQAYLAQHWADAEAFSWSTLTGSQLEELSK